MEKIITIDANTIDTITEADIQGTPMSKEDLHSFRLATSFSKIKKSYWKKLLPSELKKHQIERFNAYYDVYGGHKAFIKIDYIYKDVIKGVRERKIEKFSLMPDLKKITRENKVEEKTVMSNPYPYTPFMVANELRGFRWYFECGEYVDEMWVMIKNRILKDVIPCVRNLPFEERVEIIKESSIERETPYWTQWAYNAMFNKKELKKLGRLPEKENN